MVDDGIQTLGESLDTLDCLEKLGVKSIWLTPHVIEDIPNTSEKLRERFQLLLQYYSGATTFISHKHNLMKAVKHANKANKRSREGNPQV